MKKVLVIVAHPDDEVLGVGGTILKHVASGDRVYILIFGEGESSRGLKGNIKKREAQALRVAKALGVHSVDLGKFPDNQFDKVPLLEIVKKLESTMARVKPDIIYTHHIRDLNVDHRIISQAALTGCRPQPGFSVKKILNFETPSSTEWQIKDSGNIFCPAEYVNIEDFIEKKLEILKIYCDELKKFPHPRSLDGVRVCAQYRGMEVGYNYAEAFHLTRNLID